jgi:hypothetical protein
MEGIIMKLHENLTFYKGCVYSKQHKKPFPIKGLASKVNELS